MDEFCLQYSVHHVFQVQISFVKQVEPKYSKRIKNFNNQVICLNGSENRKTFSQNITTDHQLNPTQNWRYTTIWKLVHQHVWSHIPNQQLIFLFNLIWFVTYWCDWLIEGSLCSFTSPNQAKIKNELHFR